MRELIHRLLSPFMSYGARHHLGRRLRSFDYRFIGALLGLVVAILLVLRFGA
jgi:hypothetical protein